MPDKSKENLLLRIENLRAADASTIELSTALNDLASVCFHSDPEQSMRSADEAFSIVELTDDLEQKGRSLRILGAGNWARGEYKEAQRQLDESLRIFRELGSRKDIADTLNNIGLVYDRTGDYEKALEIHLDAMSIRMDLEDRNGLGYSLSNIGNIYAHLEEFGRASEYYEKALEIREELGDRIGIAEAVANIGMVNASLEEFETAFENYSRAYEIYKSEGHRSGIANSCINIGKSLVRQSAFSRAIRYFMLASDEYTGIGNRWGVALSSMNMGNLYMKQDNVELAEEFFFRSLDISREIGERNFIMRLFKYLSDLYEKREEYRKSLEYYREYVTMREELLGGRRAKGILRLEAKELEREIEIFRERETVLLEKQKEYRYLSITDPLTGLYNRRHFLAETEKTVSRSMDSGEIISLAMVDIDHLKEINDTLGHSLGDRVLEEFAILLRKTLRPDDTAARYGGDEFVVLLRHCSVASATEIFRDLATSVRDQLSILIHNEMEVTISCGVADLSELPLEIRNSDNLIDLADKRLYAAKNAGRNQVTGSEFVPAED